MPSMLNIPSHLGSKCDIWTVGEQLDDHCSGCYIRLHSVGWHKTGYKEKNKKDMITISDSNRETIPKLIYMLKNAYYADGAQVT